MRRGHRSLRDLELQLTAILVFESNDTATSPKQTRTLRYLPLLLVLVGRLFRIHDGRLWKKDEPNDSSGGCTFMSRGHYDGGTTNSIYALSGFLTRRGASQVTLGMSVMYSDRVRNLHRVLLYAYIALEPGRQ